MSLAVGATFVYHLLYNIPTSSAKWTETTKPI